MNVMQSPGADLPYGKVPGPPLLDGKTFLWPSPIFGKKIWQKSRKIQGPHAMQIPPGQ